METHKPIKKMSNSLCIFIGKLLIVFTKKDTMDFAEGIRVRAVLPLIKGKLLDVGCGYNNLVRLYKGKGVGVDVFNWGGRPDYVVKRTDRIPFEEKSFDTITFLACLNHIPYRISALKEAVRILKEDGQIIITMIGLFAGKIAHMFAGKDEIMREFEEGEVLGLSDRELKDIFNKARLEVIKVKKIFPTVNKIYILRKSKDKQNNKYDF